MNQSAGPPLAISPDAIIQQAAKAVGVEAWDERPFRDALTRLTDSFQTEAQPSQPARQRFFGQGVRQAAIRLQQQRFFDQNPDVLATEVRAPLFIAGMPRAGTTLLQNLLSLDPQFRPLKFWEQETPFPPPDPDAHDADPRIEQSVRNWNQLISLAPVMRVIHDMDPKGPGECNGLFENLFATVKYFLLYNAPGYADWLMARDMTETYEHYKRQLQLLAWRFPPRPWLLKAPAHLFHLDALLAVFPDARVILPHRDPAQVLPSTCSLVQVCRRLSSDHVDAAEIGAQWLDLLDCGMQRADRAAEAAGPDRVLNLGYKSLVADPVAAIRGIYGHFGIAFSDELGAAIEDWLAANRQHKHGAHRYALEDFGLDETQVRDRFAWHRHRHNDLL